MNTPSRMYNQVALSKDSKQHEIRLFGLMSGALNDKLVIHLYKQTLTDDPPEYEALSYAWGSQDQPGEIRVIAHGSPYTLPVTRNLEQALRHLRHTDRDRTLWVDAICINQANPRERSRQVAHMGRVYQLARQTVVWLGPEADDSSLAIETLREISSKVVVDWSTYSMAPAPGEVAHWADRRYVLPYPLDTLAAVTRLFERSWFERLWTLQEVSPRNGEAVVVCGYASIPWRTLLDALFCFRAKGAERIVHASSSSSGQADAERRWFSRSLVELHNPALRLALPDVLHRTSLWKCADERDRVYAAAPLAGVSLGADLGVAPDYEKPVGDVYTEFVVRYMAHVNKLNVMAVLSDHDRASSVQMNRTPSWVPPFHRPAESRYLHSLWASGDALPDWEYLGDGVLRVAGIRCATVTEVRELALPSDNVHTLRKTVQKMFPQLDPKQNHDKMDTYVTGCSMTEALGATLSCTSTVELDPPSVDSRTAAQVEDVMAALLRPQNSAQPAPSLQDFTTRVYAYNRGRALVRTREGYIALAPRHTRPGDVLAVLLGLDTPAVLREQDDGRHAFVGGCFAYGLSCAEALFHGQRVPEDYVHMFLPSGEQSSPSFERVFRNRGTGEVVTRDPRLSFRPRGGETIERDELVGSGVEVEDFMLV